MPWIAVGASLVIAGYLIVSATSKAIRPEIAAAALTELGLRTRDARVAVAVAVALELAVAAAIVLWPHSFGAEAGCASLFGVFALLAMLAARSGRSIECGCLGSLHRSVLGWTQILQFGVVTASMVVLRTFAPALSLLTGLGLLLAVEAAASALILLYLFQSWWQVRRDRISLASVRAYVRRSGWPELVVADGEVGVR